MASLSLDLMVLARSDDSLRGGDGMLENPMCYFPPNPPCKLVWEMSFSSCESSSATSFIFCPSGPGEVEFRPEELHMLEPCCHSVWNQIKCAQLLCLRTC